MKKTISRPEPPKRLLDVMNTLVLLEKADFASHAGLDGLPEGKIQAYNDAVSDTHYSEALTGYAVGWKDPESLDILLDQFAPVVPVARRFEYREFTNTEEFLIDTDDERYTGSSFKEVRRTSKMTTARTVNRGLRVILDRDEIDEMPGAEEVWTGWLLRRLVRSELVRAIALLDAASTNAAKTWGNTANPDADLRAAMQAAANVSGLLPDTVVFGDAAWNLRLDSYEAQNTPNAGIHASYTADRLAAYLMASKVLMNKARYQSTAAAKAELLGSKVYLYLAGAGLTAEDPSNIKRFVSAVDGGGQRRVYRQELDAKRIAITVEHYSQTKITSTLGIRKITASA
jgi:hypothetical protein